MYPCGKHGYRKYAGSLPDIVPSACIAPPLFRLWTVPSYALQKNGKAYTCFMEEYAIYPILGDTEHDRKEVIEHLGVLAAKYSGADLSETKSMWSIIDLNPLDVDIGEKQENANTLIEALRKNGLDALAKKVGAYNTALRKHILPVFASSLGAYIKGI